DDDPAIWLNGHSRCNVQGNGRGSVGVKANISIAAAKCAVERTVTVQSGYKYVGIAVEPGNASCDDDFAIAQCDGANARAHARYRNRGVAAAAEGRVQDTGRGVPRQNRVRGVA